MGLSLIIHSWFIEFMLVLQHHWKFYSTKKTVIYLILSLFFCLFSFIYLQIAILIVIIHFLKNILTRSGFELIQHSISSKENLKLAISLKR